MPGRGYFEGPLAISTTWNTQSQSSQGVSAVKNIPKSLTKCSHSWPITYLHFHPLASHFACHFVSRVTNLLPTGDRRTQILPEGKQPMVKNEIGSKYHKTKTTSQCTHYKCVSSTGLYAAGDTDGSAGPGSQGDHGIAQPCLNWQSLRLQGPADPSG